jgi:hypothetical protein
MPRPRQRLSTYFPALSGDSPQGAVTLMDMGAQILDQTFVTGTPGLGVNVIAHSFNTTNVAWSWMPTRGVSFMMTPYEVTNPTATTVVFGINSLAQVTDVGQTGQVNRAVPGRMIIVQRQ